MKISFSLLLQVCLSILLSLGAVNNVCAAAAGTAGDVAAALRNSHEVKLNSPSVALTDVAILDHARAANENVYSALQSFVCKEEINRFRGSLSGDFPRQLDSVTAKLSFEKGVESYSEVFQDNVQRPGLESLTGAWSEGEFGTLLLQTQMLLQIQKVDFDTFSDFNGEHAAIYHFDVAADDSPWDLAVGERHYRLPFTTVVWIAVKTGEILKIDRTTLGISAETRISQIQWGITLDRVALNGGNWLLPTTGTYAVLYNGSHHRDWNQIAFTGYQRYSSQTALKFD